MNMIKTVLATLVCLALAVPASAQNAPAGAAQPQQGDATAKINLDKSELYKAIDKNKDGKMSYEEWHGVGMPDSSWKMLNKDGYVTPKIMEDNGDPSTALDGNGDGKITLEEFLAFDKSMGSGGGQGGAPAGGQGDAPQGAPQGGAPVQGTQAK